MPSGALRLWPNTPRGGDKVQMCYAFEFLAPTPLTAQRAVEVFARLEALAPDAWPCWAFSNHDTVRHVTRWKLTDASAMLYATLLVTLRGSLCLYQGEELGLPEADVAFEDLQDPYGIQFWPEFKGRDGCRTPMAWVTDNANGGFSGAAKTWLPVDPDHLKRSVAAQDAHSSSMLHHYRRALGLRAAHPALKTGSMQELRGTRKCPVVHPDGWGPSASSAHSTSATPRLRSCCPPGAGPRSARTSERRQSATAAQSSGLGRPVLRRRHRQIVGRRDHG